ncbi:helix-turn-helix domain-containing protein [Photobacterium kishitanii]|uniref:helix-turn-helix domain-containing protein n=1 Tax=Photobacterium kishitanii TaxID=318456 RepID=UPI0007F8DB1A|nr:helix-turn-helix transcriptional regulator [Photobacterium kishitanii]OBU28934.1 hypothetical protein AYY23_22590 [Photobacterium kishitanii]
MTRETSVLTIMGLIFKELRLKKNITQSSIAEHIGMTSAGWGKLENGKASLSVENMMLVCSFLEISPIQLFSEIDILTKELEKEEWDININRIEKDCLIIGKDFEKYVEPSLATGGVALISAPAVGTLSGAAASAAGLATLGGGAIAAGGTGMAGGTAIGSLVIKLASAYVWSERLLFPNK